MENALITMTDRGIKSFIHDPIIITQKIWDRLPDKAKFRGKRSLYVLQIFEWWATPKMSWRACTVTGVL